MSVDANLPQHLLESIKRGRCVLFAGAGLSIPLGMPCWNGLVERLIDEVASIEPDKGPEFESQYSSNHLMQAADYAKSELGPIAYFDVLRRFYGVQVEPHINHILATQIPFRGIITTNFDKMLETSFTIQHKCMPVTFTALSMSALASVLFRDQYFIFKLHGDVDYPESIILTRQDFDRIIFNSPHVKTFLQTVFLQNTILYVGYSLSDPDFDLVLTELSLKFASSTPPHYAILPNPDRIKAQEIRNRMNIRTIPYDPKDDHALLTEILIKIKELSGQLEGRG